MLSVKPSGARTNANAMNFARRGAAARVLILFTTVAAALTWGSARAQNDPSAVWQALRFQLFGADEIRSDTAGQVITLNVPDRAMDASVVPVGIEGRLLRDDSRRIERIWLVIDGNPSPLAAEFRFMQLSARADIETRVRIDKPGQVRAIARLSDGSLHQAAHHVQASGGCSVPMNKDPDRQAPDYGDVRLRLRGTPVQGEPLLAQLMVRHPNSSGFAINPSTQQPQSAHFVRHFSVRYGNAAVLEADIDFSISENPNFRFWVMPEGDGEMSVRVVDSDDRQFAQTMMIRPRMAD